MPFPRFSPFPLPFPFPLSPALYFSHTFCPFPCSWPLAYNYFSALQTCFWPLASYVTCQALTRHLQGLNTGLFLTCTRFWLRLSHPPLCAVQIAGIFEISTFAVHKVVQQCIQLGWKSLLLCINVSCLLGNLLVKYLVNRFTFDKLIMKHCVLFV